MVVRRTSRRGAALLMVLFAVACASLVLASLGEQAGRLALARRDAARERTLDGLLDESERIAATWLQHESEAVVLSPSVSQPRVSLMDWKGDGLGIRVVAFDQLGMLHLAAALSGSPLRLGALPEVLAALDAASLPDGVLTNPGLDDLEGLVPLYLYPGPSEGVAIGASIATHGPGGATLNAATTPMALLRTAYRQAGLGSMDEVVEARLDGHKPPAPGKVQGPGGSEIEIVSSSSAWAFRIDLQAGPLRRSWWSVFEGGGDQWTLVQRLWIDA